MKQAVKTVIHDYTSIIELTNLFILIPTHEADFGQCHLKLVTALYINFLELLAG